MPGPTAGRDNVEGDLELLFLGTGGPYSNPTRASSGCVVLAEGSPAALVDAGGGTFERLGRSLVPARDLGLILITHLHIDHTGDIAPIVFAAAIEKRTDPFTLLGPAPSDEQPGVERFAELLFGPDGAWSYLHSFDGFEVNAQELPSDADSAGPTDTGSFGGIAIRSVAVPHGMMPAIAYRLSFGGRSVVFCGDVSDHHEPLVELAEGCDSMVCHMALPEREVEHGDLHTKPSVAGRMAREAGCEKLILSHFMPQMESELNAAVDIVRGSFDGEIVLAEDLLRVRV